MRLFAHGFELCLATLEAVPQLCGSVRLFSKFDLQVALKVLKLEKFSVDVVMNRSMSHIGFLN
jgi:hypothetical protein